MKHFIKNFLLILIIFNFCTISSFACNQSIPTQQGQQWIQEALRYGFDMKTQNYTKYMSEDYIEHIDGKVFNFSQWLHHMKGLKEMMKSYVLTFDEIMVEGDQIATSYVVHAIKKDNTKLDIRIIAIFKLKNGKMVYCDELTHVIIGKSSEKEIGARD